MAVTFIMTTDKSLDCGYVRLANETVYGTTIPDREEDHAVAWWVYEDGVYSDANLNNENEWDVTVSNNHTYTFYGALTLVWSNALMSLYKGFDTGCIVYYNGTFYISTVDDNTTTPGTSGAPWDVLVESDINDFTNNTCGEFDESYEVIECPNYNITKQACYIHRICDASNNAYKKLITVRDYIGNTITTVILDPAIGLCGDITLSADGVYVVEIKPILTETPDYTYGDPEYLVIYEYCALENCAWFLIDKILCSGDPCAEICNPCDPETIRKQQQDRQALNQLIALFGSLMMMIHTERVKYMGYFSYPTDNTDLEPESQAPSETQNTQRRREQYANITYSTCIPTRENFVQKIGMMMQKITELTKRCGMCYGQLVTNPYPNNVTFTAVIQQGTTVQTCRDCE